MSIKRRRVRLTDVARRDLRQQADFIRQRDDDAAISFIQDLISKIYQLAATGVTGSGRSFLPTHVRAFPYRGRCFYFTVDNVTFTVLRVLHSAQDVKAIVFELPE